MRYKKCFENEDVVLINDSFEIFMSKNKVECVVSPANSFGLMDGGFDLAITKWYGDQLQKRVQQYIIDNFYGEQHVGSSFIIETGKENEYLIHTLTMQTPQPKSVGTMQTKQSCFPNIISGRKTKSGVEYPLRFCDDICY